MKRVVTCVIVVAVSAAQLSACGSDAHPAAVVQADRCVVRLHGKGDHGADTIVTAGVAEIAPTGNASGWGGRQWLYFPEDRYTAAVQVVTAAVDATACERVVIDGFSNGASFAASMLCHGETLGGRLVGVVVDDPVTDAATANCNRDLDVGAALYWTGALDAEAPPGTDCSTIDWTCQGGVVVGIDAYAAAMALTPQASPSATHTWYRDAPEIAGWLAAP